jgi:hypothetical protein
MTVSDLKPGTTFMIGGREYRLIDRNSCRARVQQGFKEITVNDKTFRRPMLLDIAPGAEVDAVMGDESLVYATTDHAVVCSEGIQGAGDHCDQGRLPETAMKGSFEEFNG